MSMYGDDRYNEEKNDMYSEIEDFVKNHSLSELLEIIADVIKYGLI